MNNALKIVHEWDGHSEIFSLPPAIENSRQHLLLPIDISKKTVTILSAPEFSFWILRHKFTLLVPSIMANQVKILGLQRFVLELNEASLFLRTNIIFDGFLLRK